MATVLLLSLGWALLVLRTVLQHQLPWGTLLPETGVPLLLYLALKRPTLSGGIAAFSLGYLTDLFSLGHNGLAAVSFLAIFAALASVSDHLFIRRSAVQASLTFVMALAVAVVQATVLALTAGRSAGAGFEWGAAIIVAVLTALVAPPLFSLCNRVDERWIEAT